jgi:hypothetical protein
MPRPISPFLALTVLAAFTLAAAGCGDGEPTSSTAPPGPGQNASANPLSGIEKTPCKREFAADFNDQGDPLPLVIGCFVVAGSDQTFDVSAEDEDFGRKTFLCLNRHYLRIQVRSTCTADARPRRIRLLGVEHPRSAPRGTMVAIGIVPVGSDEVVVDGRTKGGADQVVDASVNKVPPVALHAVHRQSFRYFLAALPASTYCAVKAVARLDGAPVSRASRRKVPC